MRKYKYLTIILNYAEDPVFPAKLTFPDWQNIEGIDLHVEGLLFYQVYEGFKDDPYTSEFRLQTSERQLLKVIYSAKHSSETERG